MKKKSKVFLEIICVILITGFILTFTACKKKDNTVNPEENNTIYIELNALADGFGDKDGIAQNEEITRITNFFNVNDQLWGFMALGLSYLDSTKTRIPADSLSSWLKKPKYYLPGPYTTEQIQNENDMDELASLRWSVYLAFVIKHSNDKYYIYRCYKVYHGLVKQWYKWTEIEIN